MSKIAIIREYWPSIPGHGEESKLYPVRVTAEFDKSIIAKRHFWSRNETFPKKGSFVWVEEIKEES